MKLLIQSKAILVSLLFHFLLCTNIVSLFFRVMDLFGLTYLFDDQINLSEVDRNRFKVKTNLHRFSGRNAINHGVMFIYQQNC